MEEIINMDYEAMRKADFILIDKDLYYKFIPVEWKELEKWREDND